MRPRSDEMVKDVVSVSSPINKPADILGQEDAFSLGDINPPSPKASKVKLPKKEVNPMKGKSATNPFLQPQSPANPDVITVVETAVIHQEEKPVVKDGKEGKLETNESDKNNSAELGDKQAKEKLVKFCDEGAAYGKKGDDIEKGNEDKRKEEESVDNGFDDEPFYYEFMDAPYASCSVS